MNRIRTEQQVAVVRALSEGSSVRSTERMTGVHRDTILRFVNRLADGCARALDQSMRNLPCARVQCDEIWGFIGKKQRHLTENDSATMGDVWTFVAMDADTKLVPAYRVGKRTAAETRAFVADLSTRMANRVQLSTDGLSLYVEAVEQAFGGQIDYGTLVKSYEAEPIGPGRYSPPKVVAVERTALVGDPDPDHISTSYIERQNLTMRMGLRRLTRLTNAFSKKLENFKAAVAVHFTYYNFVRIHRSLRVTPAMAAGVCPRVWSMEDLVSLADW